MLRKKSGDQPDDPPAEHLKRSPRALPEIEIRDHCGERSREESRLASEIHCGDHHHRRYGLERGYRCEDYPAQHRKCRHTRDEDHTLRVRLTLFKSEEKGYAGEQRHAERDPRILLIGEEYRSADNDRRNNAAEDNIRDDLFLHSAPPLQNPTTCPHVTALGQSERAMRLAAVV